MAESPKPSVLVAMTAFKGSLSNLEASKAVAEALTQTGIPHQLLPLGDGGSGTSLPLHLILGGEYVSIESTGPMNQRSLASVLCFPNSFSPTSIFLESSDTCGWALTPVEHRNAMTATSRGLGKLIHQCCLRWPQTLKKIFVGLGDSAINDVGIGMLSELGVKFFDEEGNELSAHTENLSKISRIDDDGLRFPTVSFTVLCDVQNTLCGPLGSARVFAAQKGASFQQVIEIENGMSHFAGLIERKRGTAIGTLPMTGSAGGLATAFLAFFNAALQPGCEYLLEWINFDALIRQYDLVITGEGRTDKQTLSRKAPAVISEHVAKEAKKLILISGSLAEGFEVLKNKSHVLGCFDSGREPDPYTALVSKTTGVLRLLGLS